MNQISWLVTTYHAWVDANHWVSGFIQVAGHHRARIKHKWGRKSAPEPYRLGKIPSSATCYHVPLGNILTPSDLRFLIWQGEKIRPIPYSYSQGQISKYVKCSKNVDNVEGLYNLLVIIALSTNWLCIH